MIIITNEHTKNLYTSEVRLSIGGRVTEVREGKGYVCMSMSTKLKFYPLRLSGVH